MKFSAIKALPVAGRITADWKQTQSQLYANDPATVKKDYKQLVMLIADLELIEEYLRKQVLSNDATTNTLRKTVGLARELGFFIAPLLNAILPGSVRSVNSVMYLLDSVKENNARRELHLPD
jgi:hypothetical protein